MALFFPIFWLSALEGHWTQIFQDPRDPNLHGHTWFVFKGSRSATIPGDSEHTTFSGLRALNYLGSLYKKTKRSPVYNLNTLFALELKDNCDYYYTISSKH